MSESPQNAVGAPRSSNRAQRLTGVALVLGSAVVWSTGGLFIRSLGRTGDWTIIFWRSISASAFLAILIAVRERGAWREAFTLPGLLVALCFAASSIAIIVALGLTSVANALIIMSSAAFFAAVLGWLVLGESVRLPTLIAIGVSMTGIGLMVSDSFGRGTLVGDLIAFVVAISYAGAIVTTRRYRALSMMPGVLLGSLVAALIALPFASPLAVDRSALALLVVFGAGQFGLGLALFVTGAPRLPAAVAALLGTLEPILGPFWVWLWMGEQPSTRALAGGAIVLAAVLSHIAAELARGSTGSATGGDYGVVRPKTSSG
jgi:drug/metabolite transporter (DMT)-like permease